MMSYRSSVTSMWLRPSSTRIETFGLCVTSSLASARNSAPSTTSEDSSTTVTSMPGAWLSAPGLTPPPRPITSALRGSGWTATGKRAEQAVVADHLRRRVRLVLTVDVHHAVRRRTAGSTPSSGRRRPSRSAALRGTGGTSPIRTGRARTRRRRRASVTAVTPLHAIAVRGGRARQATQTPIAMIARESTTRLDRVPIVGTSTNPATSEPAMPAATLTAYNVPTRWPVCSRSEPDPQLDPERKGEAHQQRRRQHGEAAGDDHQRQRAGADQVGGAVDHAERLGEHVERSEGGDPERDLDRGQRLQARPNPGAGTARPSPSRSAIPISTVASITVNAYVLLSRNRISWRNHTTSSASVTKPDTPNVASTTRRRPRSRSLGKRNDDSGAGDLDGLACVDPVPPTGGDHGADADTDVDRARPRCTCD